MPELSTQGIDHIDVDGPEGKIALARKLLEDAHEEINDRNELGVAVLTDSALSSLTKADRMLALRQRDAGRVVAQGVKTDDDGEPVYEPGSAEPVDTLEEGDQ